MEGEAMRTVTFEGDDERSVKLQMIGYLCTQSVRETPLVASEVIASITDGRGVESIQ
jgi:hypothetical protein